MFFHGDPPHPQAQLPGPGLPASTHQGRVRWSHTPWPSQPLGHDHRGRHAVCKGRRDPRVSRTSKSPVHIRPPPGTLGTHTCAVQMAWAGWSIWGTPHSPAPPHPVFCFLAGVGGGRQTCLPLLLWPVAMSSDWPRALHRRARPESWRSDDCGAPPGAPPYPLWWAALANPPGQRRWGGVKVQATTIPSPDQRTAGRIPAATPSTRPGPSPELPPRDHSRPSGASELSPTPSANARPQTHPEINAALMTCDFSLALHVLQCMPPVLC